MTETAPALLPAELVPLDVVVPVGPLARLTSPGAPRWAYGCLAVDICGPLRRTPRLGSEVLERGLAARPAQPRKIVNGYRERHSQSGTVRELVYRDGPMLPAQPAVPPLRRTVERAGTEEALAGLVTVLDRLAGQEPSPEPDAPESMLAANWPMMRSLLGETAPPLRWTPSVGGTRRPELAALYPAQPHPRLVGIPRAAPAVRRKVEGIPAEAALIAADGRLLALLELLRCAARQGVEVAREDVARLVGWVAGPERAVLTLEARAGRWGQELATTGAAETDRALAHADVGQVTDQLLGLAAVEVNNAG